MKRLLLLAALGLFALAIPFGVSAADDPLLDAYNQTATELGAAHASSLGGADVAVGHGTSCANPAVCASPRDFQFAGASSVNGGVAGGVYSQTLTVCVSELNCEFGTFRAHVECVTANGNVATLGGTIFQSTFTFEFLQPGEPVLVTAYDNGKAGDPTPDFLSFITVAEPVLEASGQCLNQPSPPRFPVVDGDIMVRDGQLVGNP